MLFSIVSTSRFLHGYFSWNMGLKWGLVALQLFSVIQQVSGKGKAAIVVIFLKNAYNVLYLENAVWNMYRNVVSECVAGQRENGGFLGMFTDCIDCPPGSYQVEHT